jgi:Uma2 family endonuclease
MSTIATPPPAIPSPAPVWTPSLYRMTVDEYERIGPLLDDPRVELIDGHLVKKMSIKPEHSFTTCELSQSLEARLPAGWMRRQEQPVRIPDYDEPEPDISIIRGSNADYRRRMPTAADVALLVEVAESSLSQDRGEKLTAYGKSRIPVYWIVNLIDRQVEVYTNPGPGGYQSRQDYPAGSVVPVVIDGQLRAPIAVDDILP